MSNWKRISPAEYLATYNVDMKIMNYRAEPKDGLLTLLVVLAIDGQPVLRHRIYPTFAVDCWKRKDTILTTHTLQNQIPN